MARLCKSTSGKSYVIVGEGPTGVNAITLEKEGVKLEHYPNAEANKWREEKSSLLLKEVKFFLKHVGEGIPSNGQSYRLLIDILNEERKKREEKKNAKV